MFTKNEIFDLAITIILITVCVQLSVFLVDSKMDSNQKECGIIPDMTDGLHMAGEGIGWGMMYNDFIKYDRNYNLFFTNCM